MGSTSMDHLSSNALASVSACVVILAHNEANNIIACLESVNSDAGDPTFPITVVENGSSDDTARLVAAYAKNHPNVSLISLSLGDKCNAWNHFIFTTEWRGEVCIFLDGDCRLLPGSLNALAHCLSQDSQALAATAFPISGRNVQALRRSIQADHGLVGGLYALKGPFLDRMREAGMRLPVGMVGDDSLIAALAKWNLSPFQTGWVNEHIVLCAKAEFSFDSVPMHSLQGMLSYWRRCVRYGRRKYEMKMLRKTISLGGGLQALPERIVEVYWLVDSVCTLQWNGIQTFFDWLALRQIRARKIAPPPNSISTQGAPPGRHISPI